ncbi:hypothetical protein ERO13_A05G167366v2 [Gossypium hirsutum]|nr:hypothetical protein ERO13_A05G167366v2 [Gossypium hirsutum]
MLRYLVFSILMNCPIKFTLSVLMWMFFCFFKLDHAAKIKSTPEAEKYYAETASTLNDVISKLG